MRFDSFPARELPGGVRVLEAHTRARRAVGLAGLDDLDPATGLELAPCRSIHSFGMRFALDLIWVGAEGAVVRVDRGVARRRFRTCLRARSVIEVRAGSADRFLAALA